MTATAADAGTSGGRRTSPRKAGNPKNQGGKDKREYDNPRLFITPDAGPIEFLIFPEESRFARSNNISLASIIERFGGEVVSEPTEHAISLLDVFYMDENDLRIPLEPDWPNDLYSSGFVFDCIHNNRLVDLNKHRRVLCWSESLFEAHDANEILFKQISWKQLKKKSGQGKKRTHEPVSETQTPVARDGTFQQNMVDSPGGSRIGTGSFTSTPNKNVGVSPNVYRDPLESDYSRSDDSLSRSSILKDNTNRNDSPEFLMATPVPVAPKRSKPMPLSVKIMKEQQHQNALRMIDTTPGPVTPTTTSKRSKPAHTPEPDSRSPNRLMELRRATKSTPSESSRARNNKSPQPCSSKSLRLETDANANTASTVSLTGVIRNQHPSGDRVSPIRDIVSPIRDPYDIVDDEDDEDDDRAVLVIVPTPGGGGRRRRRRTSGGNVGRKRYRTEYTLAEDRKIFALIIEKNWYHRTKGREMWQEVEKEFHPHTYQSLKEHFRRKLIQTAHLPEFNLTKEQIARMRANFENVKHRKSGR